MMLTAPTISVRVSKENRSVVIALHRISPITTISRQY